MWTAGTYPCAEGNISVSIANVKRDVDFARLVEI
jgi:hypothetical protein